MDHFYGDYKYQSLKLPLSHYNEHVILVPTQIITQIKLI